MAQKYFDDEEIFEVEQADSDDVESGIVKLTYCCKADAPLEKTKFKVLVELMVPEPGENRPGIDVVVLLDVSRLMIINNRFEAAKYAITHLVHKLNPKDRLSVVTFSSRAQRLCPLRLMTRDAQVDILDKVFELEVKAGTNFTSGLEEAVRVVKDRQFTKGRKCAVMLISHGTPYPLDADGSQVPIHDVPVYTFGLGPEYFPTFITFGFNCTPLYFPWRKVIGMQDTRSICLWALARLLPFVISIWFLAHQFQLFWPINSTARILLVSFIVYIMVIIPALTPRENYGDVSRLEVLRNTARRSKGKTFAAENINTYETDLTLAISKCLDGLLLPHSVVDLDLTIKHINSKKLKFFAGDYSMYVLNDLPTIRLGDLQSKETRNILIGLELNDVKEPMNTHILKLVYSYLTDESWIRKTNIKTVIITVSRTDSPRSLNYSEIEVEDACQQIKTSIKEAMEMVDNDEENLIKAWHKLSEAKSYLECDKFDQTHPMIRGLQSELVRLLKFMESSQNYSRSRYASAMFAELSCALERVGKRGDTYNKCISADSTIDKFLSTFEEALPSVEGGRQIQPSGGRNIETMEAPPPRSGNILPRGGSNFEIREAPPPRGGR